MIKSVIAALAMLSACGAAQAVTTFSFASDTDSSQYTFGGIGSTITQGANPGTNVVLTVDDGNGPAPALTFNVQFRANFTIQHVISQPGSGGSALHIYNLDGGNPSFGFYLPNGQALLTATITGGNMRSLGTTSAWGTGGNIEANDIVSQVAYTWQGDNLAAYGLITGATSSGGDDAAFTLTNLSSGGNPGVGLSNNLPNANWLSEGSFSGTALFVPAPGAMAIFGLGGLALARRRR